MFARLWLAVHILSLAACVTSVEPHEPCGDVADVPSGELKAWLDAGCFDGWEAESGVLQATMSDGHAQVFINPVLAQSMVDGNALHPVGSAAVRVMYLPDLETVWGYALAVKSSHGGQDDWFWFEHFEHHEEPTVSSHDASGCQGCHASGADFIQSHWPLR